MSSKTKIVVFHLKELIYTAIFAGLGILLILLLIFMFLPGRDKQKSDDSSPKYIAGVYPSSIKLNDTAIDVEVVVDQNHINSIRLVNLDETVSAMYPLMQPALENIASQVTEQQTTENIVYGEENKFTSMVLLEAINNSLEKAKAP